MIFDRHQEMKTRGDKEFWARGYFVETIGNIGVLPFIRTLPIKGFVTVL